MTTEHSGEAGVADPAYRVFEVFQQKKAGDAFVHVGDIEAPDGETAALIAKEHFLRREKAVALWAVDRRDIYRAPFDADVLASGNEKRYRRQIRRDATADILPPITGAIATDESEPGDLVTDILPPLPNEVTR